jgi:formylglycine-generating enzyme required for sulfatase activity
MYKLHQLAVFALILALIIISSLMYAQSGSAPAGFVWIPPGTFQMGSPKTERDRWDNETLHKVTLSAGFYMAKYPVTQELYQSVMGRNPSSFKSSPAKGETQKKRPVEHVSWYDAVEFCNKLSIREKLQPVYTIAGRKPATGYPITDATVTVDWGKNGYRLPTDAEWEYACRAGKATAYNLGNTWNDNWGWYDDNSGGMTREVGQKKPNAWGLYDMHGNVFEWCWDVFGDYGSKAVTNPKGAASGECRVIRGGSWGSDAYLSRSACRVDSPPFDSGNTMGFRLARNQ